MFTAPLPERPETDWLAQLQVMAQQQPLSYLHFWGHAERAGTLTRACLSQWYPAPFVVAGGALCHRRALDDGRKSPLL